MLSLVVRIVLGRGGICHLRAVGYLYFEEGEVFGSGGNVKLGSSSMSVFYYYLYTRPNNFFDLFVLGSHNL